MESKYYSGALHLKMLRGSAATNIMQLCCYIGMQRQSREIFVIQSEIADSPPRRKKRTAISASALAEVYIEDHVLRDR